MTEDRAERHRARMARRKARVDADIAAARQDKGLLLVLTGPGKGKSSSAFGMLARPLMNCTTLAFRPCPNVRA
ncbi:MAG TPA: cob(I)yrinic acid a,c-diamide adenosyltransferase, partial [Immundisolibacter sp.]|nr:cob(I)yrinic acid a,c-diamide adenosyltransferase [Immundisolibacter sp.]